MENEENFEQTEDCSNILQYVSEINQICKEDGKEAAIEAVTIDVYNAVVRAFSYLIADVEYFNHPEEAKELLMQAVTDAFDMMFEDIAELDED